SAAFNFTHDAIAPLGHNFTLTLKDSDDASVVAGTRSNGGTAVPGTYTLTVVADEKLARAPTLALAGYSADPGVVYSSAATADSGLTWTYTLAPYMASDTAISIQTSAGGATDLVGNTSTVASAAFDFTHDGIAPLGSNFVLVLKDSADAAVYPGTRSTGGAGGGALALPAGQYQLTVVASEALSLAPVLTLPGYGGPAATGTTSDNITWTYTLVPLATDTAISIQVDVGGATDIAGNESTVASAAFNFTHDAIAPLGSNFTLTLKDSDDAAVVAGTRSNGGVATPFTYTLKVVADEPLLSAPALALTGYTGPSATGTTPAQGGGKDVEWTYTLAPSTGDTAIIIQTAAVGATDLVGNISTVASTAFNFTHDAIAPLGSNFTL
ncbi:MAG: hypothetical protein VX239_03750, partial [Candidatus Thermoplasmatota archaeon]|nr:hypothetical protein [Candidatus Thermoplasmatota archaeon]